jgi:microcystin-dependent protein
MKQTQVATGIVMQQKQQGPNVVLPQQSIDISMLQSGVLQYFLPPGALVHYCGITIPNGYLACDGSLYEETAFPALYAAIGTTFNLIGDAAGYFRVPDARGKAMIGAGQDTARGLSARTLGEIVGEETHTLLDTESGVAAHTHTATDSGHVHGVTDPSHNHSQNSHGHDYGLAPYTGSAGGNQAYYTPTSSGYSQGIPTTSATASNNANVTGVSVNAGEANVTVANAVAAPAANAHNNMQPSLVIQLIIKY